MKIEFKIETSTKLKDETNKFVAEMESLAKEHKVEFIATTTIGGDIDRKRFEVMPTYISDLFHLKIIKIFIVLI